MSAPWRRRVGWAAVAASVGLTSMWAFWGATEAFHEGWYFRSLWRNLALTSVQYLAPMLGFLGAALIGVRWPAAGGATHVALGIAAAWFFNTSAGRLFIGLPLVILGLAYWTGRAAPRRRAVAFLLIVPSATALLSAAYPAYRVATRVTDGSLDAVVVDGRGVRLRWAPRGPGWPDTGASWFAAAEACEHLDADGVTLAATAQRIWRLPTVDEVVRSATLHRQNSGGEWNAAAGRATFRQWPDKEPPLWNPYSQVIYWWTATEIDADRAVRYVYNGRTAATLKRQQPAYYGYRCVTTPPD